MRSATFGARASEARLEAGNARAAAEQAAIAAGRLHVDGCPQRAARVETFEAHKPGAPLRNESGELSGEYAPGHTVLVTRCQDCAGQIVDDPAKRGGNR